MSVFFTADTHFGHQAIIKHCGRPFSCAEEMDEAIIHNWNSLIRPTDTVWHLGDFAWKHHERYLDRLRGKIHLVLGNHDKMSASSKERFASVNEVFMGKVDGNKNSPRFFLFHYPCVSWPRKRWEGSGPGSCIHLFGHVHGRYSRATDAAMDVGVDCRAFYPFPYDEVLALIDTKMQLAVSNPPAVQTREPTEDIDAKDESTPEDAGMPQP